MIDRRCKEEVFQSPKSLSVIRTQIRKPISFSIMLFSYTTAAYLLALCGLSNAAAFKHRRDTLSDITVYAYGTESNGDPVFYANGKFCRLFFEFFCLIWELGLAYIGQQSPGWSGTTTNITFTSDSEDTSVPWTIAANSTSVSFNETYEMYIVPTSGSFTQVGFTSTSSNSSLPSGAVTTGFGWFGTSVAYVANASDYELMFWAASTNVTGIYALYWDAFGTPTNGSFPVALKSTPPIAE